MAKEQAAVFELRVVVEKGADAPVEGSEAVRTRAGAFQRVGALPVGIRQRAARRAVHAANQVKGKAGKFVQQLQGLRRDAVRAAVGRGGFMGAAQF